jgi:hypothetical protein
MGPTQPAIQWAVGTVIKQPERASDHSALSITEVKNGAILLILLWHSARLDRLFGLVV